MGSIEAAARSERRKGYLQDAVLASISVAGMLALALVAPNTLQLLGGFGARKRRFGEQARSAANRLASKGYVKFVTVRGRKYIQITEAGQRALERAEKRAQLRADLAKPKRWDRRWRMIVFDIPEQRKSMRDRLRETVQSFGFLRLQDSVWIYPYDCEELIVLIKADLRIGKEVLYAIIEKVENDGWIRKHFGLSR